MGKQDDAIRDYFFGGAGREVSLSQNRTDWDRISLIPRVLHDVSEVDIETELVGKRVPTPVVVAPMAFLSLIRPRGEAILAEAAALNQLSFCLSSRSSMALESVAEVYLNALVRIGYESGCRPLLMFQIYVMRDQNISASLFKRAIKSGFDAIVVTVDAPYIGLRPRDRTNNLSIPDEMLVANVREELLLESTVVEMPTFGRGVSSAKHARLAQDPSMTWAKLEELCSLADSTPILLKGILDPADAALASSLRFGGVIVSNHGGRQLDGAISTPTALHQLQISNQEPFGTVVVDGSIETGSDIVKARALGADGVMMGRIFAKALLDGGPNRLHTSMSRLIDDLHTSTALMGFPRWRDIDPSRILVPKKY